MKSDINKQKIRLQRLRILQVLNMVRPDTLGDGLIRRTLSDELDIAPGIEACRKALDYLEQLGLVKIDTRSEDVWVARILAKGVDFLDGFGDQIAGVAHPDEF